MCLGTNESGHKRMCVGTNVSGHKRVWAQTCVGTNVCGHKRVWAQSCGHSRVDTIIYGHKRGEPLENLVNFQRYHDHHNMRYCATLC